MPTYTFLVYPIQTEVDFRPFMIDVFEDDPDTAARRAWFAIVDRMRAEYDLRSRDFRICVFDDNRPGPEVGPDGRIL